MNSFEITGRLTANPEIRKTTTGKTVMNVSIAVASSVKGGEASFFNVTIWEKTAEIVSQYCKKGDLLLIAGHLFSSKRMINEKPHTEIQLVCDKVEFLASPHNKSAGTSEDAKQPKPLPADTEKPASKPIEPIELASDDDDLPF